MPPGFWKALLTLLVPPPKVLPFRTGPTHFRRVPAVTKSALMDMVLVFAAFGAGIVVGVTGMGGAALMTPSATQTLHTMERQP